MCARLTRGVVLQEEKGMSVFTGWLPSFFINSRLGSRSQRGSGQTLRQTLMQTLVLRDCALGATSPCSPLSFQYHVPGPLLLGSPVPLIRPPQAHLLWQPPALNLSQPSPPLDLTCLAAPAFAAQLAPSLT